MEPSHSTISSHLLYQLYILTFLKNWLVDVSISLVCLFSLPPFHPQHLCYLFSFFKSGVMHKVVMSHDGYHSLILLANDIELNPGPLIQNQFLSFMNWNINSPVKDHFGRVGLIEAHNTIFDYDLISICETNLTDSIEIPEPLLKTIILYLLTIPGMFHMVVSVCFIKPLFQLSTGVICPLTNVL